VRFLARRCAKEQHALNRRTFVAGTVTAGAKSLSSGSDANAQTDDAIATARGTLDLADRAASAINALIGALEPEFNHELI
jgi:methionine synthase I (cobalamin-dependent)